MCQIVQRLTRLRSNGYSKNNNFRAQYGFSMDHELGLPAHGEVAILFALLQLASITKQTIKQGNNLLMIFSKYYTYVANVHVNSNVD